MHKTELLLEFEKITDKLNALDLTIDKTILIEKVKVLLNQREKIIEKSNDLKEEQVDSDLLNRIIAKNLAVETHLKEIVLLIQDDLAKVVKEKSLSSVKKKANRGYMNVGIQRDGYFIDKKK
ncbi:MAG: hypothetical protein JXR88_03250 [Clostridia bacterium]|nr:hypothetical protein [Clostridia bacterium]